MIIEIRGAEFVNKGAELMLLSVIKELKERLPDVTFVVEPKAGITYEDRIKNGLYAIVRHRRFKIYWGFLIKYLPQKLRKQIGIVLENEIDSIIDISGFAYGDYWGVKKLKGHLTDNLGRWKRKNIKIFLLPQAFGPFKDAVLKKEFKKVLSHADFIAARDPQSYQNIEELCDIKTNNVFLYPDITPSINIEVNKSEKYQDYIFIIPNEKMLNNGVYIKYLHKLVMYLSNKGIPFAFLIHEGIGDYNIARKVINETGVDVDVIYGQSAIETKKIIANAKLIITSRFHGLVNGLSQSIPSLSTSWSHKYEELLEYYEFKRGLINDLDDFSLTEERIEYILENHQSVKRHIKEMAEKHSKEVDKMWDAVVKELNK